MSKSNKPTGAAIQVIEGEFKDKWITCDFNPKKYSMSSSVKYKHMKASGAEKSEPQFTSRDSDQLKMELFFDTSRKREDVRKYFWGYKGKQGKKPGLDDLVRADKKVNAPPRCKFVWGKLSFTGLVTSVDRNFTMFLPDGTPVRATANVTFKRTELKDEKAEGGGGNSGLPKSVTIKKGDTLWDIAGATYGDPTMWRLVAKENGITDPRSLQPGKSITLPKP